MSLTRADHARRLFDGIARPYEWPAELLSFGQYGRWRRFAVSRLPKTENAFVLDVATGTGLVARDARKAAGARVVGLDQSDGMLAQAKHLGMPLVAGSADRLPFSDGAFDGLTHTYLLRYVDDPEGTLAELSRTLKPGGVMVSVEFGRPATWWARPLWDLHALHVMRIAAGFISPGWREVGGFLGRSIVEWTERYAPGDIAAMWRRSGLTDVRFRELSFGAGVVTWGRRK